MKDAYSFSRSLKINSRYYTLFPIIYVTLHPKYISLEEKYRKTELETAWSLLTDAR